MQKSKHQTTSNDKTVTFRISFPKKLVDTVEGYSLDIGFSFIDFVKLLVASYAEFGDIREKLWDKAKRTSTKEYYKDY